VAIRESDEKLEGTESQAEVDDPAANSGKDLGSIIAELNPVLRGFINYFRVTNCTRGNKPVAWVWLRSSRLRLRTS